MSAVTGVELVPLDYETRLQTLLRHGVGLWDVVAAAHRPGSLDSQIRDRDDNDLLDLLTQFHGISAIAFNGGTAKTIGLKVLGAEASRFRIVGLPSSSPAFTMPLSQKLEKWSVLRDLAVGR